MASSQPPPSAKPFTAAIAGLGGNSVRGKPSRPRRASAYASAGDLARSSAMSAPATKARPAPVMIAAATDASPVIWSTARPSSAIVASFSALSLSGRLTVIVAMRSATANCRKSYVVMLTVNLPFRTASCPDDGAYGRELAGEERRRKVRLPICGPAGSRGAGQARARIARLRVPPAWRDVHIAADARRSIQAWGFDARGRKQYRYHDRAVASR